MDQGYHRGTDGDPRAWVDDAGTVVTDSSELARLRALALPPAWTHVWAAADPDRRIQATGVDGRGRTQYRYSAAAVAAAAENKFHHVLDFAGTLPALRAEVERDLGAGAAADRAAVLAAIVRLLDRGLFRIGNERYARDNHTYGLTTIRRGQVTVDGSTMTFDYVGKEHLPHLNVVTDAAAGRILGELLAVPGEADTALFVLPPATRHVDSHLVNAYLHARTGAAATAKAFRTWSASVVAAATVAGAAPPPTVRAGRRTDRTRLGVLAAATMLGDTPAVARAAYVHPRALGAAGSGELTAAVGAAAEAAGTDDVSALFGDAALQAAVLEYLAADD